MQGRSIANYAPIDFVPDRGEGAWLLDTNGRRVLDFATGIAVNALGHAHPRVTAAIADQAARYIHTSNLIRHPGYDEVCGTLGRLARLPHVYLANSGTEAMEAALKLSRRHHHLQGTPRGRFAATEGSFHGRTLGALSVTGQEGYREGYSPLFPCDFAPFGDADALPELIDENTAAFVIEPIQGNGGILIPPKGYLERASEICRERGALLIVDEIQTGIGRTGHWFAVEHEGVQPDILVCAKALGGGLPLGAMLCRDGLENVLSLGTHGTTFGGNPVACAAALATLSVIEDEGLVPNAQSLGDYAMTSLGSIDSPSIAEVRGRGLMIGVELSGVGAREVRDRLLRLGVLVTTSGKSVLRILPPLIATKKDIDTLTERLREALAAP